MTFMKRKHEKLLEEESDFFSIFCFFVFLFCFSDSMYVTGSKQPQIIWSNASRLMVRNHILKQLHSILKINKTERINFGA